MNERSEVRLWDRQATGLTEATLIDLMSQDEVTKAAASWKQLIDERIAELNSQGTPRDQWPEHAHWDWRAKAEHISGILAYQILGIECDHAIQGMMLIATEGKACRVLDQHAKPLVYIHFLATAPWNDPDFVSLPRYGGVGKVFIAAAIQLSIDNGFKGRIGLHSLPQADQFYSACGMTDLGQDSSPNAQNLHYYEMTQKQAETFMTRGQT